MDGIFFVIIGIEFGKGYRKNSLFGIIFLIRGSFGGSDLMVTYYCLSFLIGEIWLDLRNSILLGTILFSVHVGDFP